MRLRGARNAGGVDGGFTLIEMLVGLALLALIMTMLTQLIFEARHALALVDRSNGQTPIIAVQGYLRNALAQVQPILNAGAGDQSRLGLAGEDGVLAFTTSYATQGTYQGLYRVEIRALPNGRGGLDLKADETMYRPATGVPVEVPHRQLTLLENIAGVGFSYYRALVEEGQPSWVSTWPPSGELPGLVSIEVQFPKGDARVWRTFMIRPAAAGSSKSACPLRMRCE
jgi:prepilin-type N-terminal cleavage/methylation domain-containing protein